MTGEGGRRLVYTKVRPYGPALGLRLVPHQELYRVRVSATGLEFAHKAFAEAVVGLSCSARYTDLSPPSSKGTPCGFTVPDSSPHQARLRTFTTALPRAGQVTLERGRD